MTSILESLRRRRAEAMKSLEEGLTGVYTSESAMYQKVKSGLMKMKVDELEALSLLIMYQND